MNVDNQAKPDSQSDLGLLFIHGIGRQEPGQTLAGWLDPLCGWMRDWLDGAARYATSCGVTKEELSAVFTNLGPEAKRLADAAFVPDKPRITGRRGLQDASLHYLTGTVEVDAATITSAGDPPNASVRLKAIDTKGNLVTASITVAEAFWQQSFPKPAWKETTDWLLRIVPLIVLLHFGNPVRERWSAMRRRGRSGSPPGPRQLAKLAGDSFLLILDIGWLLAALVVLPLLELVLLLLVTFGWLPIPGYRHILTWVQEIIASVLGDAYIFASSPTRLAAVVTQTRKSLDWLIPTSKKVIVVAHSQGAAVAYHLLNREKPPVVAGLITLGSGLKKLHFLKSLPNERDPFVTFIVNYSLAIGGMCVAYLLAGRSAFLPSSLEGGAFYAYLLIFLSTVTSLIASFLPVPTDEIAHWWNARGRAGGLHWLDVYASRDPVSDGPLFEAPPDGIESEKVINQASLIADHTAYWDNADEFVAMTATWMSRIADLPIPLHKLNDADAELLQRARTARLWRVRFLRVWQGILYGTAILVAARFAPAVGQYINQAICAHAGWLLPGPTHAGRFLGLSDCYLGLLCVVMGTYLARLVTKAIWRWWTNFETKSFCSREPDVNFAMVFAFGYSAPTALIAGVALEAVFPGWGVAISLPFFVILFFAVMKMHPDVPRPPKRNETA